MEPRISIAAGMIKTHRHVPMKLLQSGLLSSIKFGSYTFDGREGNEEPTTWIAEDQQSMMNAINLKNLGIHDFVENEQPVLEKICRPYTNFDVSLAPTKAGELRDMCLVLMSYRANEVINELEINGACPNHKSGENIEPVLAYDMEATERLLAEATQYHGAKAFKIAPRTERAKLETIVDLCLEYGIGRIVSGNTLKREAVVDGKQVLSVPFGGYSGLPLLSDTVSQVGMLQNIISEKNADIRVSACGGILKASDASFLFTEKGVDEVQVATLYWTKGEDAVAKLITETGLAMTA